MWRARGAGRVVMQIVQDLEEIGVPALILIARGIMRAVQRTEEVGVGALVAAAQAAPRGLQRVEESLVPGLIGVGRATARGMDRTEGRLVPALPAAWGWILNGFARSEDAVARAVRTSGRGLLEGTQRVEAYAVPAISPRVVPSWGLPGEYVPAASEVYEPPPNLEIRRLRLRSAGYNAIGLLVTAWVVILAVIVTADATVGNAVRETSGSVDVVLRRPEDPTLQALSERSYIYAASGQELQVLDRHENRRIVGLAEIPLPVQQAVLTAEDQRFDEHEGYDISGIARALVANVEAGDITQGGSTITQQLAKSAVGSDRTVERKTKELAYAVALEEHFTKDQLLEQYLNQVYFGENAYGVAAAAEEYFGISDVTQLRAEHGALLAGMIRSPNSANPRTDPEAAMRRRDIILDQMVPQGFLDQATVDAAKLTPLGVVPPAPRQRPYDFIADSVIREFLTAPEFAAFGATLEEREAQLYGAGLRIYSSLDTRLQDIAQATIAQHFPNAADPTVPTGAIVSVEPATGRILAAHSGVAYDVDQLAIPTQGRRQLGSSAKPFVYAEALRQGYPPNIRLNGTSPAYFENCPDWRRRDGGMQNYGGASLGIVDMPNALRQSVNTSAAQLSQMVGVDRIVGLMGEMGIDTQAATGGNINCSLALGGFTHGVTPLEAASAYATFANNGVHIKAHFIDRIEDRSGNRVYEAQHQGVQVLSPEANALMVQMMQGVVTGGTGTRAAIPGWPVAGKTGTTDDNIDAWFVGYTPNLATASWMGAPVGRRQLNTTGGGTSTIVWQQYMAAALQGQAPIGFPPVAVPDGRLAAAQPAAVPSVTGLNVNDAVATLNAARLGSDILPAPNPAPAGTVIAQNIPAGASVATGDTIVLFVSTG